MDANIILILLAATGLSFSDDCSSRLGTDNEIHFTAARDHRFYLNTVHPALCSGTVTSWRYCYYVPSVVNVNIDVRYRTSFAVYRRILDPGNSSDTYERVSDVFSITVREEDLSHDSSLVCNIHDVNDFTVEAGDIVGACIFDPDDSDTRFRNQLDIAGEASGYSLLHMADVSTCNVGPDRQNRLPSSIPNNMLSVVKSRVLHLYANIESKPL